MQFVAQPVGVSAAVALTNRGPDPSIIAANTYAFFLAVQDLLRCKRVVGNKLSAPASNVAALLGDFFVVDDPSVLATHPTTYLPTPDAYTDLVAFLVHDV